MEKLLLYLIVGSLLGLSICLVLSKKFFKKKNIYDTKELNNSIQEKEIYLKKLENDCAEQKNQLDRLVDESIVCKHNLLQKSNLLRKKIDELHKIQEKLDGVKSKIIKAQSLEKKNKELAYQISKLTKESSFLGEDNKLSYIKELQRLRTIIIEKDKEIQNLKQESYENTLQRKSSYIEISKDQFKEIEKRLKEYKHKADILEYENTQLNLISKPKKEFDFFEKINYSISNLREVAFSNLFRDNYEKISKA